MVAVALEDQNANLQRGNCAALLCTHTTFGVRRLLRDAVWGVTSTQKKGIIDAGVDCMCVLVICMSESDLRCLAVVRGAGHSQGPLLLQHRLAASAVLLSSACGVASFRSLPGLYQLTSSSDHHCD